MLSAVTELAQRLARKRQLGRDLHAAATATRHRNGIEQLKRDADDAAKALTAERPAPVPFLFFLSCRGCAV